MKELYELRDKLCDELKQYGKKDMSAGSLDVVDKLTHTIKNLDKIIEKYEEEGYSGRMPNGMYDGNYVMASDGRSYARGRGTNAKRDSRGRYSSRGRSYESGYSYDHETIAELREMMEDAPNEEIRQDYQRIIHKMESM